MGGAEVAISSLVFPTRCPKQLVAFNGGELFFGSGQSLTRTLKVNTLGSNSRRIVVYPGSHLSGPGEKVSESLWLTISRPFWACLLMRCHLLSPDPSTVQFRTMKGSASGRESAGVLLLREVNILNVPSEPGKEPNREQLTLRCNWKAYHNTSWRQSELPVCAANCEKKSPLV